MKLKQKCELIALSTKVFHVRYDHRHPKQGQSTKKTKQNKNQEQLEVKRVMISYTHTQDHLGRVSVYFISLEWIMQAKHCAGF